MIYVDYDPEKHKGFPLYEIQSAIAKDGSVAVVYELADERMRQYADKYPYNFAVNIDKEADNE